MYVEQLVKQINTLVGEAQNLRKNVEEIVRQNDGQYTDEAREMLESADKRLDEAENLKEQLASYRAQQRREADIDAFLHEGVGDPPPTRVGSRIEHRLKSSDEEHDIIVGKPREQFATVEYAGAFDAYLRQHVYPHAYGEVHRQVLQIAVDEAGGYTVPEDHRAAILKRLPGESNILAACRRVPTSRDQVIWTRILPHATDGSIYTSAFVGSYVSETPAASAGEAEPVFGQFVIHIRKARAKAPISRDWVADSEVDVMALLREDGAQNLALVVENGILNGSGVLEPDGLLNDGGVTTVDVEGTTSNTISNTTSDLGSATKLLNLQYALPSQYWNNARFAMHRLTEKAIRKLVDADGRFIWAAGFAEKPNELLGYPIARSDFMPQEGTDGNKVVVWGDFRQYIVPMRQSISAQVLLEVKAEEEQIVLILRLRHGGGLANPDAMRFGIV